MNEKRRDQEPPQLLRVPRVCHCAEPMLDEEDTDDAPLCWKCGGCVLPDPPEAA